MRTETAFPETAPFEALISASSRIVTVSHFRPDGDAAGSLMACTLYLRSRGLEVTPVLPCPLAPYLAFMAPPGCGLLDYETSPEETLAAIRVDKPRHTHLDIIVGIKSVLDSQVNMK